VRKEKRKKEKGIRDSNEDKPKSNPKCQKAELKTHDDDKPNLPPEEMRKPKRKKR